ncbi:MAG: UDP-N-acetylmuramate--L-alanine ligase [Gemmatimonadetes bacterium]|nr:UDP-N-acetylmuramate--L-alanine ligase [Gemmatimonadota bacterium]
MGVGGAGMEPLAELMLRGGLRVSGCDQKVRPGLERLTSIGLVMSEGHGPEHLEEAAVLVITSAVPPDHPEVLAARERGIPVFKRAEALGAMVNRGRLVAVAGTHGKTTTTALTTHVLAGAGLDPTGLVGGEVLGWNGNLRLGSSDLFVVEADEYDRSFHTLTPDVAVVTNVEADHLDIYGDMDGVMQSFVQFVDGIRPGGSLWICGDDGGAARLATSLGGRTRTYGLAAGCQLRATDLSWSEAGNRFRVWEDGQAAGEMVMRQPGRHNVRNALAAVGVARTLGAAWPAIADALADFPGVGRRYQVLGSVAGVTVIDDYAHHPTEISATLQAVRGAHGRQRIVAVFQPHLFSRTRDFAGQFGEALGHADAVWVTDVYPAREAPIPGVDGRLVADAVTETARVVQYHPDLETLAEAVAHNLVAGDVCVTMGAGSVETVGPALVSLLRERAPVEGGARAPA